MATNNDVQVTIKLLGADRFKNDAQNALGSLNKETKASAANYKEFGKTVSGFGKAAIGTFVAVAAAAGAAFVSISKQGIQVAADLETTKAGFTTLLGSAEEAQKAMEVIKKDAAKTPFDVTQLARLNQMLTGITKNAAVSQKFLLDVGEAIVGMGRGTEEMDRIIVNLQQIGATGKASMIDIKQFAFAGIPIFQMLQKETGLSGDALEKFISDGRVSFELLQTMFDRANDSGGQFFNAYANNANTFTQKSQELKESWNNFTADFVTQTGIFDMVKMAMAGLLDFMSGSGKPVMDALRDAFIAFGMGVQEVLPMIEDVWNNSLKPAFVELGNTIAQILGYSPEISNWKTILIDVFRVLGASIATVILVFAKLIEITVRMYNAWLSLQTVGKNVSASISSAFLGLKNTISGVVSSIVTWFISYIPSKIGAGVSVIKNWFNSIPAGIRSAINTAIYYAESGVNRIIKAYNDAPLTPNFGFVSIPRMQNGGIVPGNQMSGDRVLARVNSGEMVLNRNQQSTLFNLISNLTRNGMGTQNFNFNAPVFSGTMNRSPMQQENLLINLLQQVAR